MELFIHIETSVESGSIVELKTVPSEVQYILCKFD